MRTDKTRRAAKRNPFADLGEGMTALRDARQGKRTLRTRAVVLKPVPGVTARELVPVRQNLRLSRALFAAYLRTKVRTLENWEQGRARPNAQAVLTINLVAATHEPVGRGFRSCRARQSQIPPASAARLNLACALRRVPTHGLPRKSRLPIGTPFCRRML